MQKVHKILVANRGEIAARIIRTIHKLNLAAIGIYAADDCLSLHVELADESFLLDGSTLQETYLNGKQIISIALRSGCDTIHPGYGFLSENESFASTCEEAGLIFIGPSVESIRMMGNKVAALEFARACKIPTLSGIYLKQGLMPTATDRTGLQFPVLVKPGEGGGGKGMRIIYDTGGLDDAILAARREAQNYFGDDTVYLETYIENPKHIEVQVLGDGKGKIVHLFERECSLQRRFQKMIEEAPAISLTKAERERVIQMAVSMAEAARYKSAGTLEFLMDQNRNFFFLEMNTRIQVEHPVTEMITGIDLVEEQIRIADSDSLRLSQGEIRMHGHSIEARIYAEDPLNDFMPSPGNIVLYLEPKAEGVRLDKAFSKPFEISARYDPMISKLIVHGSSRQESLERMRKAIKDYKILGIETNLAYLSELFNYPAIIDGSYTTHCIADFHPSFIENSERKTTENSFLLAAIAWYLMQACRPGYIPFESRDASIWNRIGHWRQIPRFAICMNEEELVFESYRRENFIFIILSGTIYQFEMLVSNNEYTELLFNSIKMNLFHGWKSGSILLVEIDGTIHTLSLQKPGSEKPSYTGSESGSIDGEECIHAPMHGKIVEIHVKPGQRISKGEVLMILEAMKMENNILSPADGIIDSILVDTGVQVEKDSILAKINM